MFGSNVGQIVQGHVNEALNKEKDLYTRRIEKSGWLCM